MRDGRPSFEQLMARVQAYGIVPEQYQAYADRRWGRGWKINPSGRAQAWNELECYGNDPQGYLDKIASEIQPVSYTHLDVYKRPPWCRHRCLRT